MLTETGNKTRSTAKELEQIDVLKLTKQDMDAVEEQIAALPPEEAKASAALCYSMVLIRTQKGDARGAKEWQNELVRLRGKYSGSPERDLLENRIFSAGMAASQTPNANLILNLSILAHEHGDARYPLARLSATNKTPSVLRGAKDLSFLTRHYKASVSIVKPLLGVVLEDGARGVCEVGIAELLYETGDLNGASLHLAGAISAANPEIAFAALAMMARIGAVDPAAKRPDEILAHIGQNVVTGKGAYLLPNFLALKARFDMLRGDQDAVRDWMRGCGLNDLDGGIPFHYYQLITKCRGYLALGEYRDASTLAEGMILSLQEGYRPLDTAECLVVSAITCDVLGSVDVAYRKLEKALESMYEFGYIRVFSDFGKPLHSLLSRYIKDSSEQPEGMRRYLERILESAKIYGMLWPRLFAAQKAEEAPKDELRALTAAEQEVLLLLESGRSNRELAEELGVSANTIKYHLKNLYEKLAVSNRMELVMEAKKLGLLA